MRSIDVAVDRSGERIKFRELKRIIINTTMNQIILTKKKILSALIYDVSRGLLQITCVFAKLQRIKKRQYFSKYTRRRRPKLYLSILLVHK